MKIFAASTLLAQVPPAPPPQPVPEDLWSRLLHDWTVLGPAIAALLLALIVISVLLKRRRKALPPKRAQPELREPRVQRRIELPPSEIETANRQQAEAARQEVEQ